MALSGSGWESFTRISSQYFISSKLHSWSFVFLLCINVILLFIKLLSMFMILPSTLSVIRRLIDLWQQLELTSNLEFDLQDAVD